MSRFVIITSWPPVLKPTDEQLAEWADELQALWLERSWKLKHPNGIQRKADAPYAMFHCRMCDERKPLTEFRLTHDTRFGRETACKMCRQKQQLVTT